jgi:hypothetical protein
MKKLTLSLAVTMLALSLPASIILTISPLGGGRLEIVASGLDYCQFCVEPYKGVLQSTIDFVDWTSINTNFVSVDGTVTNVVQTTNTMLFYRVKQQ